MLLNIGHAAVLAARCKEAGNCRTTLSLCAILGVIPSGPGRRTRQHFSAAWAGRIFASKNHFAGQGMAGLVLHGNGLGWVGLNVAGFAAKGDGGRAAKYATHGGAAGIAAKGCEVIRNKHREEKLAVLDLRGGQIGFHGRGRDRVSPEA